MNIRELPEHSQPQQPTYPQIHIQVAPEGAMITIMPALGVSVQAMVDVNTMNQMVKLWRETRKNIADQLRVIEHAN